MSRCSICRAQGDVDYQGDAPLCGRCYGKFERSEQLERLIVAMDSDIESDERLKAARVALEAARAEIARLREWLGLDN